MGIIGVVAAMTMPVLINKQRDMALVSQLKKTYSVLGQAVYELNYEYGGSWKDLTEEQVGDDLISRLKVLEVCKFTVGCWEQAPVQYLRYGMSSDLNAEGTYKFKLSDGTSVRIRTAVNLPYFYYDKLADFEILVDVNGQKKPNRIGRDIFYFAIRDGKLIPLGLDDEGFSCTNESYGYTCAWKVLTEGKFTY